VKAEYDYLDFGTKTVTMNGSVAPTVFNFPVSYGVSDTNHINQFKGRPELAYRSELLVRSTRKSVLHWGPRFNRGPFDSGGLLFVSQRLKRSHLSV
jgi:hypothetical protein